MELVTERLGVDDNTAEAVINKLGMEGCLQDDEVEGQWRILSQEVVTNILPKYIGKKGKKTGKGHKTEDAIPSQEGTTSGAAGDIVDKKIESNGKMSKCSKVAGSAKVPKYVAKRILVEGEGAKRRNSKRRKVSEVNGNLQI